MAPTVDIIKGIFVSFSIPLRLRIQAFKRIHIQGGCDSIPQISGRLRNKSLSNVFQTCEPNSLAIRVTTQI